MYFEKRIFLMENHNSSLKMGEKINDEKKRSAEVRKMLTSSREATLASVKLSLLFLAPCPSTHCSQHETLKYSSYHPTSHPDQKSNQQH